jgi:hypothetical protein
MDSILDKNIKTGFSGFIGFLLFILTFLKKVRIPNPPNGGKEIYKQPII